MIFFLFCMLPLNLNISILFVQRVQFHYFSLLIVNAIARTIKILLRPWVLCMRLCIFGRLILLCLHHASHMKKSTIILKYSSSYIFM